MEYSLIFRPIFLSASAFFLAFVGATTPLAAQGESPAANLESLKSAYRREPARPIENAALVELGRELFWDPVISASGTTSCGSCHLPQFGWATNDARSKGDSGRLTSRKSQTLIGIGHAAPPFGWDGRNATLEAQAVSSIGTGSMSMFQTKTEVKVEDIVDRIRASKTYPPKFREVLPTAQINLDAIVIALAAFERTIEPAQAPFDRWIAGDEQAISTAAKRGFVLFNGKANCSGCHGGWRFTDDQFHDIGTSTSDRGRGREIKDDEMMQFAFKTPTLRSVALRAPYMHNGSQATLHDVTKHYMIGGIDRPSRSPLMQPLDLNEQERNDLIAFMLTLSGEPTVQ